MDIYSTFLQRSFDQLFQEVALQNLPVTLCLDRAGLTGPVPAHLRDAHYKGAAKIGHGAGYQYAHDAPAGVVTQQYAPDTVAGRDYYTPSDHGAERGMATRLGRLRAIIRGTSVTADVTADTPPDHSNGSTPAPPSQPPVTG